MGFLNVIKYGLRIHRLADPIPWNRFLGYLNVYKYGLLHNLSIGKRRVKEQQSIVCLAYYVRCTCRLQPPQIYLLKEELD
jgi:hypothetical protein